MMESLFPNGATMAVIGFILGAWFTLIIANFGDTLLRAAIVEIEKCEQNIPRNQHCKIAAIPE